MALQVVWGLLYRKISPRTGKSVPPATAPGDAHDFRIAGARAPHVAIGAVGLRLL